MKAGVIALIVFGGLTFPAVRSSPYRVTSQVAAIDCKNGDIVLRNGKGFISSVMRNTSSREKKYSHAGIIILTDSGPYVIHSIGNNSSRLDGVRAEPLSEFISAAENLQYGVYRYELTEKQQNAVRKKALEWKKSGVRFDTAFDLVTCDKVYCSELIYRIYQDKDVAADYIEPTSTAKGSYIGLDDLYLNENCRLVTETLYEHE